MSDKLIDTRFTLQFSRTDPTHLQVAEILNRQGRRSKAQYIVNAVLYYENCSGTPAVPHTLEVDIKAIEAVVYRILQDRENQSSDNHTTDTQDSTSDKSNKLVQLTEEISYDDALEALGSDGVSAIAGAMEVFRKK